ncbi:hypothetical protein EB061_03655 [bacterium]|nr:hypothetical protein [bacterium]
MKQEPKKNREPSLHKRLTEAQIAQVVLWWKEKVPVKELEYMTKEAGVSRKAFWDLRAARPELFPERELRPPPVRNFKPKNQGGVDRSSRDQKILELALEGKSNRQIAAELAHIGVTTGTAAGVVWRNRDKVAGLRKKKDFIPVTRQRRRTPRPERVTAKSPSSTPPEPRRRINIERPTYRNLDVLELKDSTCKYAVNETKPYLFCGAPTRGSRYHFCPYHHALSTIPADVMAKKPRRP